MSASRIAALCMLLVSAARGQVQPLLLVPPSPPLNANPLSQANQQGSALIVTGNVHTYGVPLSAAAALVGPADASMTLHWLIDTEVSANSQLVFGAQLVAFPESPFALLVRTVPGTIPCCSMPPWLPDALDLPLIGRYHLGQGAVPVFDGFGAFGTPDQLAITDIDGVLLLPGVLPLDQPGHLAVQAVVVDAAAPLGLRLTAAFAVAKHS